MKKLLLTMGLMGGLLALPANAFVPPVSELLQDVFAGRKAGEGLELVFRHLVQVREGTFVEVVETFTGNRQGGVIQWQIPGQAPVYSEWNTREYNFKGGKSIPSRTSAFIDYFLDQGSNEYLDRLLRERFIRRDQLIQFKPGYKPEGDPKTWETKDSYLHHDDIYLSKVGNEFTVAVVGMKEGEQKRAFYVNRQGRGIARIEWGVGTEKALWDFSAFQSAGSAGRLPRVFSLTINGLERVKSTVASAQVLKRDQLATARAAAKQPSSTAPSDALEEAVRLIVRYR